MDIPLLLSQPSHASSLSRHLFLVPSYYDPFRTRSSKKILLSPKRRSKIFLIRSSVSDVAELDIADSENSSIFGAKKKLSGTQVLVDSLSPQVRLATSVVFVAGALAAGYGLGMRVGGTRLTGFGGAAVLGAAGGAAVYALNSSVPEVAAASLHNFVAGCDDPGSLKREEVEEIARRYGVSKQDEAFNAELCQLYHCFLASVLPSGSENLKGNEVEAIIKFKNALGIDDPDAASVHMEMGRRFFRQRLEETGDRDAEIEQRRAFQKLVYVSTLVFGEASSFLLPWKRVFKVTDAQVEIAIRDNAQRLYELKLKSIGRDVDEKQLIDLREAQLQYRLSDEIAAEMFRRQTRKLVEENITAALDVLKSRTRAVKEAAKVVKEVDNMLAFNNSLISLSRHHEASRFAPGVGPVSLIGGEFDSERKMEDLKLLFRAYVTDSFSSGYIEKSKLLALNSLKNMLGLGKREAEAIIQDVTSKVYRRRLSHAFSSGSLELSSSKASFLQSLCNELHFDAEKASEIHEEIYRQKLQQFVADGELSENDVSALLRLRVMLCIPQEIVDAAHADICGRLFEKVVEDAIASGVDGYDADVKVAVRKASQGLRLKRDSAMAIASKAVRKMFMKYIKRSQSAGSKSEAAKELKKMIAFNTLVVTELVADIKGESSGPNNEQVEKEPEILEDGEWESLQTLRKTRPSTAVEAMIGKAGQTEITLKDDLSARVKTDIYKTYLVYCLQGEATVVPFGAQITTKKDNSEYLLLNQLGGILGLSGKEIVEVHRNLAEQAFQQQAKVILADGQINKARMEQLKDVQKQVGLPAEAAQQVIKSITMTKLQSTIETAVNQGRMNVKQIRELKEVGIDVSSMISDRLREEIFKKTVSESFSLGTGEFDEVAVYDNIPSDLGIDPEKAKRVVLEVAKSRLSESLIQAIALLRQGKPGGVVSSLNDMLACDKAVPAEPLTWQISEELIDLFLIYMKNDPPAEMLTRLQYLLGISDSAVKELQMRKDSRDLPNGDEEEAFVF